MRKILITLHRWLGFPLGLLFVITFGTGCLTAIDELLDRALQTNYNFNYVFQPTTNHEKYLAISNIVKDKENISLIILPTESTPYYRIQSRRESWTYPINDLTKVIYEEHSNEGFFRTVLQLHRNFLLGKEGFLGVEGKYYSTWVGLMALLLSMVGLWIWGPLRKSFNVKDVIPQGKKRKHFYYSHMTSGVITLVALLLLSLTGASITYRSVTKNIFKVNTDTKSIFKPENVNNDWESWINAAYLQMPQGSILTQIRYPRPQRRVTQKTMNDSKSEFTENKITTEILQFHFKTPNSWFSLDRSIVKIDKKSSTITDAITFESLPLNEKIYSILIPLHTGHNLPLLYVFILFFFSLIGTLMVFSGLMSFLQKKRVIFKTFQNSMSSHSST